MRLLNHKPQGSERRFIGVNLESMIRKQKVPRRLPITIRPREPGLRAEEEDLPSTLGMLWTSRFYEQIPGSWSLIDYARSVARY
ncbi:hypothetical protein KQX54_009990 [Cotesia glomerata]|uniref:Uncharacterized protein n=1 Tax=Cotesia glomerata TaxID=32391 RepID=A0AAV7ICS8_COTGL|nr:hypothetical protein KQX54_009990 [Cotesia glomerata]